MATTEVRDLAAAARAALADGRVHDDPVAIDAWTRMAIYDLHAGRPRRLDPTERAFLTRWAP